MQTPKARNGSSEVPQKVSPRVVRQLKTTGLEPDSATSSNAANRTPKNKSPKLVERKSPRSPAASEKKRPSRISELESQAAQLQEELKKAKEQICSTELLKDEAQKEVEESKKQLLALSTELEKTQKQISEVDESHALELQTISQELRSELEALEKQHAFDATALASYESEIQCLKTHLEMVVESATGNEHSNDVELENLKSNLAETRSLVDNMKKELNDCKESEAHAQALAKETLLQLQTAKESVEMLRLDGVKSVEAYNSMALELEQSRAHVNLLSELVGSLDTASTHVTNNDSLLENEENKKVGSPNQIDALKSEIERLRSALEAVEIKCQEDQIRSTVQITTAYELVEEIKSGSSQREAELEAKLQKAKLDIEELKANLMDKETELQGIWEENEGLHMKLDKNVVTYKKDTKLENELKKSSEAIVELKSSLMDKEREVQKISEENQILKLEMDKAKSDGDETNGEVVEVVKEMEEDAHVKLGLAMEEADKSNKRAARIAEQLEASQAANSEIEAELRRLKVQSDQWRKAAEAAAAMLSTGNNGKFIERTGSLDSNYNPVGGKINTPYSENMDDDLLKKKNGNVLKKIGVLWKKPNK